jgi:hypothetical protein
MLFDTVSSIGSKKDMRHNAFLLKFRPQATPQRAHVTFILPQKNLDKKQLFPEGRVFMVPYFGFHKTGSHKDRENHKARLVFE